MFMSPLLSAPARSESQTARFMPYRRSSIVRIALPETLTDAERAAFQELATASPFAPRAKMLKEEL